ncbi:septum formation family protein [Gordonia sp. OPL2]|uniref:septum formation family protein n=1 Tax=Gordonia sp. OPL2 TaxID=2486274 RepID=UPI0021CCBCEA|nr:septum formation family protein [Gordonia sp. OPL2]
MNADDTPHGRADRGADGRDDDDWVSLPADDPIADDPSAHDTDRDVAADAQGGKSRWQGSLLANPVRLVLAAVVIGAIVAGGIALALGVFNDSGSVGGTDIGENERLAQNDFTRSVRGDCLDWPAGNPGEPAKVACDQKHRFEVAGPLDTALLPGSEFGESATWPGVERFAAIRDEQCPVIVDAYLDGRLDPQGRFSVGMMYPSQVQWDKGARELRCGLQQTGKDGTADQFVGRVADQDQSFQWPAGTCIGIDPATRKPTGSTVNCTEAHAFQTTGTVVLAPRFGDRLSGKPWPGVEAQNDYLKSICPVQATRFLGGKNKLDATTLNVQWSVLSEPSWLAGSRTAVCYLGLPDRGGFATLVGDARSTLLINGKLPVPPPAAPPGRALPTPVPLPPGVAPNPEEVPAPAG